ncbi:MAG: type II toxin-antitoxin system HicB family antitoxin [Capsulimonadaceae bacterium]
MEYQVVIEQGETSWGAYVPDLPGIIAVGESADEVEGMIREAIPDHLELLRETGQPVPAPRHAARTYEMAA